MDPLLAIELIRGVKAGLGFIMALKGGGPNEAMAIVNQWQGARDKSIFDEDLNDILAMTASGVSFLTARGVVVKEAINLIANAEAEGRDLTDAEVESFFAATDEVAEDVDDAIAELEREEAGGEVEEPAVMGAGTIDPDAGAEPNDEGDPPATPV